MSWKVARESPSGVTRTVQRNETEQENTPTNIHYFLNL